MARGDAANVNRSLTIPKLERKCADLRPENRAKSHAQTWIRITSYGINDMRTISAQTIDSKRSRFFILKCYTELQHQITRWMNANWFVLEQGPADYEVIRTPKRRWGL